MSIEVLPYKFTYHVFTSGRDEWVDDRTTAESLFAQWVEMYSDVRLYEQVYRSREDYEAGDGEESCLRSAGEFPW